VAPLLVRSDRFQAALLVLAGASVPVMGGDCRSGSRSCQFGVSGQIWKFTSCRRRGLTVPFCDILDDVPAHSASAPASDPLPKPHSSRRRAMTSGDWSVSGVTSPLYVCLRVGVAMATGPVGAAISRECELTCSRCLFMFWFSTGHCVLECALGVDVLCRFTSLPIVVHSLLSIDSI